MSCKLSPHHAIEHNAVFLSPPKHVVSLLTAGTGLTCMKDDEEKFIFAPQRDIMLDATTCGCKRQDYSTTANT